MRVDVVLPNESTRAEPQQIVELARQAESLGYGGVWLPDHLLPPGEFGSTYGGVYEPLILLTAIAAATSRVALGTSVLILPLRPPALVAKQVATLERLAPGRVVLGVGIGWDRTEFQNLGADYPNRAARTDEGIDLIRHLLEHGSGPFEGRFYGFTEGVFAPAPHRGVDIMVGGVSDAALRRAAARADVWQGVGLTPEKFAERVAYLRAHGGDRVRVGTRIDGAEPEVTISQLESFQAVGADQVAVHFGELDGFADRMSEVAAASPYIEA